MKVNVPNFVSFWGLEKAVQVLDLLALLPAVQSRQVTSILLFPIFI